MAYAHIKAFVNGLTEYDKYEFQITSAKALAKKYNVKIHIIYSIRCRYNLHRIYNYEGCTSNKISKIVGLSRTTINTAIKKRRIKRIKKRLDKVNKNTNEFTLESFRNYLKKWHKFAILHCFKCGNDAIGDLYCNKCLGKTIQNYKQYTIDCKNYSQFSKMFGVFLKCIKLYVLKINNTAMAKKFFLNVSSYKKIQYGVYAIFPVYIFVFMCNTLGYSSQLIFTNKTTKKVLKIWIKKHDYKKRLSFACSEILKGYSCQKVVNVCKGNIAKNTIAVYKRGDVEYSFRTLFIILKYFKWSLRVELIKL